MAKEVTQRVIDDLDGTPDAATIEFAVDGRSYTIDLGPRTKRSFATRWLRFWIRQHRCVLNDVAVVAAARFRPGGLQILTATKQSERGPCTTASNCRREDASPPP